MKILSNKKYEEIKQNLTNLALDLEQSKSDNDILETQVTKFNVALTDERFTTAKLESDLLEAKKEIKKLKSLLTKNKISYDKTKKEVKKNG